ncbi:histone-lysine N-methyltransferase SETD2 [Fistulifera solaris]|jgi:serine/threonine protein kinase|uniref:Histone-lysine N-methyltransferase SETD2 n=1 Tax=Fistulifera solaris TaxID=1519565 RepID=A0A1Z5K364_FISSO|nr:histone-lysine N-methyltransferase SETD2 [Fistulifera solaris]|eukprot:GAX20693.1 histone-lysine N-methyltransferase SETD2 [Fistulifera solaris]
MPDFPENVTCSVALEKEQEFTYLHSVAWGASRDDPGYDTDQTLAPRPRKSLDVCDCPPGSTCLDNSCILFACFEECTRCNNPACQNKRLQQKQFIPTEIFDAGPKGKGLKVTEAVTRGTLITEYTGVAVRAKHLSRLFRRYQFDRRLYILALDNDTYLDARHQGGAARFINHSCEPNCQMERWKVKGVLRAAVVALKDIPAGTELTFDYQWERQRGRASTVCHCQTPSCRGTLEVQKSQTDQLMDEISQGHWLDWKVKPDQTLINRIIRVYSKEHDDFFIGEITDYDGSEKHRVLYRHTMNEVWEDLAAETWQVLDDPSSLDPSHVMIAKKLRATENGSSNSLSDETTGLFPAGEFVIQHCLLVQTNIKELLWSKHYIERCHRNCRGVQVTAHRVTNADHQIDDAHREDYQRLLQQSTDGAVWKLFLQGGDIPRAHEFLTKAVAQLEFQVNQQQQQQQNLQQQSTINDAHSLIVPRVVADALNQRLPLLQDIFRSISFQWAPSESKSKQFSRLWMDGSGEMEHAKAQLWSIVQELVKAYDISDALSQRSPLGWLAGSLTQVQLDLLFPDNRKNGFTKPTSLVKSFERMYQCTMWVQDETDRGRIDSKNQLVISDANRCHVFIYCEPAHVDRLWKLLYSRVEELERGIEFWPIHLFFFQLLNGSFFDWVYRNFQTRLSHDPILRDHIRVEGSNNALTKEVVQLQWACFEDCCRRENDWIFGRDWTTVSISKSPPNKGLPGALDVSSASASALEVAEIVNRLNLQPQVALHAVLVLYRFVATAKEPTKARDVQLASVFLAIKSQKLKKCLKLEAVIEAGYATFYGSGVVEAREKQGIAEKVLQAEQLIIDTLAYDVFWKGTCTIGRLCASVLAPEQVESIWKLVCSGQVLSAGPEVWLKYGIEYVFAACGVLLQMNLSLLLPALYLVPLKVSQAAVLLVQSSKWGKLESKLVPSHPIAELSVEELERRTIIDKVVLGTPPRRLLSTARERCLLQGIPMSDVAERILPVLKELTQQSSVTVYLSGDATTKNAQITLEGSWKAVAIAEHLMRDTLQSESLELKPDVFDPIRFRLPMKKAPLLLTSDGFRAAQASCSKSTIPAFSNDSRLKWLQNCKGFSHTGLIEDAHSVAFAALGSENLSVALEDLASIVADPKDYPSLCRSSKTSENSTGISVSMRQWPPEKIQRKETSLGFSPMALQELQLLMQLHSLSMTGHPNILLPIAICQPTPENAVAPPHHSDDSNLFSLFRSTEVNNEVADRQRRLKAHLHVVGPPIMFNLPIKADFPPSLLQSWCLDIVAAVKHCHDHDVIIRVWQPELFVVLEDGTLALSSFYRATMQREKSDPYEAAKKAAWKSKNNKTKEDNREQISSFTAPEVLLGCPQHSKQTDVWSCACLLAQLLLGKPLFVGKDPESLLQFQYKIVGAPSSSNYRKAVKYPNYVKPCKQYSRGVKHALERMFKRPHPLTEVLDQMLCLDPAERIPLEKVLDHPYFQTSNIHRLDYANDWLQFSKLYKDREVNEERNKKRKAMIEAAVNTFTNGGRELDELYDIDEPLFSKKAKD